MGQDELGLYGFGTGRSGCASRAAAVCAAPVVISFGALRGFDRHVFTFSGGVLKVGRLAPSIANLSGAFCLHLST